jgi:hypothetical protein
MPERRSKCILGVSSQIGNLTSASPLVVLETPMSERRSAAGNWSILALGTGFCSEFWCCCGGKHGHPRYRWRAGRLGRRDRGATEGFQSHSRGLHCASRRQGLRRRSDAGRCCGAVKLGCFFRRRGFVSVPGHSLPGSRSSRRRKFSGGLRAGRPAHNSASNDDRESRSPRCEAVLGRKARLGRPAVRLDHWRGR